MRSLNVAMRQNLDLYACVRPIRYFPGVSTPMADASLTDMVVFRENTEDIYAGIEWPTGSPEVHKLIYFLQNELKVSGIRFPASSGIGIKPVSKEGSQRLVRKAIQYAIENDRVSVTLVHKGNIMKYTEGAFMQWGYLLAKEEFGATAHRRGPVADVQEPDQRQRHRHQGRDRRQLPAAGAAAAGRLRRHRHAQSQRRLHLRRARGAGGRHRHRAGRQHRRRPRGVRSDARHGAGIRRQGSRESGFADPVGGDDAALHRLEGSRGAHHPRRRRHHRRQGDDLRPRAPARSHSRHQARHRGAQERRGRPAAPDSGRDAC